MFLESTVFCGSIPSITIIEIDYKRKGKISRHEEAKCTYLIRFVDLLLEPGERHDAAVVASWITIRKSPRAVTAKARRDYQTIRDECDAGESKAVREGRKMSASRTTAPGINSRGELARGSG